MERDCQAIDDVVRSRLQWPRITVVTPSLNQGRFLEVTISSILEQNYPNLEYIIIDGGSTDGSLEIIRKYEPWISYWISERDRSMYEAINKGFARATGDIMAWSNTDDVYLPGALLTVGSIFQQLPEVQWLTSLYKVSWDENGEEIKRYKVQGFNRRAFYRARHLSGSNPFASYNIQQQSTFWRRALWERAGGRVDDRLDLAGDFELWTRFYKHAELYSVDEPIGVFRFQPDQKTANLGHAYVSEAVRAFQNSGGSYPHFLESWLRTRLLSRVPIGWLRFLGSLAYETTVIVRKSQDGAWATDKRYFA